MPSLYVASDRWRSAEGVRHAGNKARLDVAAASGFRELGELDEARAASGPLGRLREHLDAYSAWRSSLSVASEGDVVVVQFPPARHTVLFRRAMRRCRSAGARVVLLVHDVELFRAARQDGVPPWRRARIRLEEAGPLREADCVVAHNGRMRDLLAEEGLAGPERVVCLGLFDYLPGGGVPAGARAAGRGAPVVIAGNLSPEKAGYVSELPRDVDFRLYGAGLGAAELPPNARYCGSFEPDEGPSVVEGSFGLVWDGPSADACAGAYGEYLRVNNPHKASLYLAAGMPVVVWDQAAIAPLVLKNGLGLAVPSLRGLRAALDAVSDEEYAAMRRAAALMSRRLRSGWHTRRALAEALSRLGCPGEAAALAQEAEAALGEARP